MSDDPFRDPFVLQVIRATLVSNGIPSERLDAAVDKVVRACLERVRRSGRAPADVGQATAIALTVVNAAAGRARARPEADAATTKEPAAPESSASPAAMGDDRRDDRTSVEVQKPHAKARRPRRAMVVWIAAGLVAALAGAAALFVGSLRPRGDAASAPTANTVAEGPLKPSPESDGAAEAMLHEAIAADGRRADSTPALPSVEVEAAAEGAAEGTDAPSPSPASVPDSADEPAP